MVGIMLERFFVKLIMDTSSKTEISKSLASNYFDDEISEYSEIVSFLNKYSFNNLSDLFSNIENKDKSPIKQPLSIEELEMLEAELLNQGIISAKSDALSKRVRREIALLIWNGKRNSSNFSSPNFRIELKSFIKFETIKLTTLNDNLKDQQIAPKIKLKQDLKYLDEFAAYLNGAFENTKSSYEKGLNLVLRAIMKTTEEIDENLSFILPISKAEFIRKINSN